RGLREGCTDRRTAGRSRPGQARSGALHRRALDEPWSDFRERSPRPLFQRRVSAMSVNSTLRQVPWSCHLEAMDVAIGASNASAAVLAWRHAYSAALDQPGWGGLVEVAGAAMRIAAIPGF